MSQIVRSKSELKDIVQKIKMKNSSIGLVPTMGALHQGHMSLVQMSKLQYDVTVVTIFVNPTQFNSTEDLEKYPRNEKKDIELLTRKSCDIIFIPDANELYESTQNVALNFGYLETIMEGEHRPGHFNGVGLIVMKLFGLVEPTGAYFGQKDLQQFMVISSLVKDFELPIILHMASVIRENDGLAKSSRNERLNPDQIKIANGIYTSLKDAEKSIRSGTEISEVKKEVENFFLEDDSMELEYFEIVEFETLKNMYEVNDGDRLALCIAVFVADIRLIDNIIIEI